jgi:hypothetical protein
MTAFVLNIGTRLCPIEYYTPCESKLAVPGALFQRFM